MKGSLMYFSAEGFYTSVWPFFSACLQQLHFWQMFWQECRFSSRRVILFISKAGLMWKWILWILLGLLYVPWEERQWLVLSVFGFYCELDKVVQLRNSRAGREFCSDVDHVYGRVLHPSWWKAPSVCPPTHRAGSLQCQHSNHAGRQKLVTTKPYRDVILLEFHIWFLCPWDRLRSVCLTKPLVLTPSFPPKHDPHIEPCEVDMIIPFYRQEPVLRKIT